MTRYCGVCGKAHVVRGIKRKSCPETYCSTECYHSRNKRGGYIDAQGACWLNLTKGHVTQVDPEDYTQLSKFNWQAAKGTSSKNVYAARGLRTRPAILLHRLILGVTDPSVIVDHKNRNTLDNRRENLRVTDKSGNAANTSADRLSRRCLYRGVRLSRGYRKFEVKITKDGVRHYLGYFRTQEDAAQVYNFKALELFGEFASYNVAKMPEAA